MSQVILLLRPGLTSGPTSPDTFARGAVKLSFEEKRFKRNSWLVLASSKSKWTITFSPASSTFLMVTVWAETPKDKAITMRVKYLLMGWVGFELRNYVFSKTYVIQSTT